MKNYQAISSHIVVLAAALSLFAGCDDAKPRGSGARCDAPTDCDSGECSGGMCTGPCDSAGACPAGLACGTSTAGVSECRPACSGLASSNGFGCRDGAEVACGQASGLDCRDCACSSSSFCSTATPVAACLPRISAGGTCVSNDQCVDGLFCSTISDTEGKCTAPRALGALCRAHDECIDGNCSAADIAEAEGLCQPAEGQSCTAATCTSCVQNDAWGAGTRCSQSCTSDSDCTSTQHCVGNGSTKQFWCRDNCFALCGDFDWDCIYPTGQYEYSVCIP